jgi:hypothetical protein
VLAAAAGVLAAVVPARRAVRALVVTAPADTGHRVRRRTKAGAGGHTHVLTRVSRRGILLGRETRWQAKQAE